VPVLVADGGEQGCGAAVLPGPEQRGREEVAEPKVDERIVAGPLDAVGEDANGLERTIDVDQAAGSCLQVLELGLGDRQAAFGRRRACSRGEKRMPEGKGRVAVGTLDPRVAAHRERRQAR
jgi:hypothetical protein